MKFRPILVIGLAIKLGLLKLKWKMSANKSINAIKGWTYESELINWEVAKIQSNAIFYVFCACHLLYTMLRTINTDA